METTRLTGGYLLRAGCSGGRGRLQTLCTLPEAGGLLVREVMAGVAGAFVERGGLRGDGLPGGGGGAPVGVLPAELPVAQADLLRGRAALFRDGTLRRRRVSRPSRSVSDSSRVEVISSS